MWIWTGWLLAWTGLGVGLILACVPGFPGTLVALFGLFGFALCAPQELASGTLPLAAMLAWLSCVFQALSPVWGLRAVSRATGAATGALVGAMLFAWTALPVLALVGGLVGGLVGWPMGAGGWLEKLKAPLGVFPMLFAAILADLLGVLAVGATLAFSTSAFAFHAW